MRLHTSPTSYYALKKVVSSFKLCRIVNKQFPSQNKYAKEQCNKKKPILLMVITMFTLTQQEHQSLSKWDFSQSHLPSPIKVLHSPPLF